MHQEHDEELQRALALSLETFREEQQGGNIHEDSRLSFGNSGSKTEKLSSENIIEDGVIVEGYPEASTSKRLKSKADLVLGQAQVRQTAIQEGMNRRRGKKRHPPFNPSEDEVAAAFEDIDRNARGVIRRSDVFAAASKLGIEVGDEQVAAMFEWAEEKGLARSSNSLKLQDFKAILDYFRIE